MAIDGASRIREMVLAGDSDPVRRGNRTVVALSQCEIDLPDDESVDRCMEALRASDLILSANPDSLYDWQVTWLERNNGAVGGRIAFGVSWYDRQFFNDRKDVFRGEMHDRIFSRIGVSVEACTVSHWIADS